MSSHIVLGAENDPILSSALFQALNEMGAEEVSQNWNVAGSQELGTVEFALDGEAITVESETYIGLTITGDNRVIAAIATRVREIEDGLRN